MQDYLISERLQGSSFLWLGGWICWSFLSLASWALWDSYLLWCHDWGYCQVWGGDSKTFVVGGWGCPSIYHQHPHPQSFNTDKGAAGAHTHSGDPANTLVLAHNFLKSQALTLVPFT